MSAIALHDILEDFETAPTGRGLRRRDHLRVVRPGETAGSVRSGEAGASVRSADPGRLTITRRGRLTLTLAATTLVAVAVLAASGLLPAAADGGETVVVKPGQTLSQIAVTELPDLPLDRAIVQLQLTNNLNSLDIQAGTELVIP